uniref:Succinate dehydrogenase subunit 4 n=2 Tax=Dystaenia TaxID=57121 RepID=A0AA49K9G5_9APIA|nr:succinate dehydrogenase subunit 4 [Dystaenia takesimana]YP_010938957.1 succinate dehydrogenase subunit 4 [Dystaenia ibukiensis]WLE73725.1 succinate dehydrogenase subunit 4 [Dystaenia takesimana]WLE73774.1 succinate dehydrogenase subunit 4 [Dystaenia ibukiensis]WNL53724.1 succinate dehydrogenase subunit 4 [Angelica biserrata]
MVLAFCRRGSVIPICLYLLVGRYMKKRNNRLKEARRQREERGLFQRITAAFPLPFYSSFQEMRYRCKFIVFFYNGLKKGLQGCPENPAPKQFWSRLR